MNKAIFQVILFKVPLKFLKEFNKENLIDSGTAFFIDSNGTFLSAGHCFKDYELYYSYAIINNEVFYIENIQPYQSEEFDENWIDFAIGTVNSFKPSKFFNFNIGLIPKKNEQLFLCGITSFLTETEEKFIIHNLHNKYNMYQLTCNYQEDCYRNKIHNTSNAFSIIFKISKEPKGLSGCPVFNADGIVFGIFCGAKFFGSQYFSVGWVQKLSLIQKYIKDYAF